MSPPPYKHFLELGGRAPWAPPPPRQPWSSDRASGSRDDSQFSKPAKKSRFIKRLSAQQLKQQHDRRLRYFKIQDNLRMALSFVFKTTNGVYCVFQKTYYNDLRLRMSYKRVKANKDYANSPQN